MYHRVEEQERHPENYFLKEMDNGVTEDECFDLLSLPRHTQTTIGLYMKKLKNAKESISEEEENDECKKKRFPLKPNTDDLEQEVERNKGFWVDRPTDIAPLTYKLRELYTVNVQKKTKREQGIFYRPKALELDYLKQLANAGALYSEEEFSDEEEEVKPDDSACLPLRKVRYKICDPCKDKKKKKEQPENGPNENLIEEMLREGTNPPFQKIPFGCQCDYFGDHNKPPTVWDNPYDGRLDMLRQHEMNKVLRPYKHELLSSYYEKNPPVKFMAHELGKKTFPVYQISNL